ncbi:unnamed protein product [Bemisia tabaci]|uniref:Non-structural maintenance of chromosomes element 4 n=1 Tax=Bemisia tabaci TaxID=7038 RepID=A0AAI8UU51_BEMTA|nr:unnamed protein product [Bemisia tabaci]
MDEFDRVAYYSERLDVCKNIRDSEDMPPDECMQKMGRMIDEMQGLSDNAEKRYTSSELCADFTLANEIGKIIKDRCLDAGCAQSFNLQEFEQNIINYFRKDDESDESLDLARFGQLGRAMLRPVPGHYSLMGHLSVEANDLPKITQRKPRQARPKDAIAELKAPIKLEKAPDKEEEGIDRIIQQTSKTLRKAYIKNDRNPISYFNFVLHPTEFSKTVQNIFRVSFLIRDGLARMEKDEHGILTITPEKNAEGIESAPKKQMISSLSVKEWRELVRVYGVTEPMM